MDAQLRTFLEANGYRILERRHEWCECLILGNGETWSGAGAEAAEAFERAVSLCFPSTASRRALAQAMKANDASEAVPHADELAPGTTELEPGAGNEPAAATHESEDSSEPEVVAPPRLVVVASPTEVEKRAASDALEALSARIDARRIEGSRLSPRRQRLLLLTWLAEARSWQSDPHGIGASAPVLAIVKKLRALTDAWWPGTVSAFQIHSTPASTRSRDLRGFADEAPQTWAQVASLAAEALHAIEREETAAGWDEDGWADRAQTAPPPPDPEGLLGTLAAEIEVEGGPLDGPQPKGGAVPPAASLERWARRLRWLRGARGDDPRWGAIAGRLRFWAQRASGFSTAEEYLDPAYRPPRSWSSLFEASEQRKQEARTLEHVIRSVPSSSADDGALLAWLDQALPLTSSHQNTILQACAGLHERILEIDDTRLGEADRRIRRRLQKLKQAIAGRDEAPVNVVVTLPEPPPPQEEPPETEVLPGEVLALTKGKRALFVGNRTDGALQERLLALLELERLEWSEATPRRVDAAVEAISSRAYDLVLGATGFMGHKYDARLARACKGAGVPYVRADRARPGAVVRALSREFGGPIAAAR